MVHAFLDDDIMISSAGMARKADLLP